MSGRRLFTDLPPFEGVAPGQTATVRLPIGRTNHGVYVVPTNLSLSEIEGIRAYANGQEIVNYRSGTELDNINKFDQIPTAASGGGDIDRGLYIPFDRPRLRRRDAEELTAIGTGLAGAAQKPDPNPVTTLTLEMDIGSGATGVTLKGQIIQSAPQHSGLLKLCRQFVYAPAASGIFEIADLPRSGLINRVFFTPSANNITNIEVLRDNFTVFDRSAAINDAVQNAGSYRTAQTSFEVVDFSELGFGSEALATQNVQDLRFKLTVDGAMSINTLVEYLAPLGR